MKLETFFENFELLTDAPNATAKLRGLILQLAVRGKLVCQDSNDELASQLIEKITLRKLDLIKKKKIKSTEKLPTIKEQEIAYKIPRVWEWVRFGDITICRDGERIPLSRDERVTRKGDYDYYGASGIIDQIDSFLFDQPLLLIGEDGANLINRSTPIAFIATGKYWVNNHAHVLDTISLDCLKYLEIYINAIDLKPYITGTAQPKMNQAKMNSIPVSLPPLAEQKRIVEKCDRLLSICDEIEKRQQQRQESIVRMNESAIAQLLSSQNPDEFRQHWQRICNNFDLLYNIPETIPKLRQAILQLAVQGKLVRQDPNDEPASALIKRMISKRDKLIANKKINNYKPQPPIELSEISFNLPNGWECVRLGEITDIVSGVTKGRNLTGRKTTYYPYLRVANVQRGFLDLEVMKEIEIPVEELEKYRLLVGDILLTEGGDWDKLGRSAIWQGQIQDCIHQNHVFRARPLDDGLLSEWAVMYTNSPVGRQYFETAAKRTTNLASINMTQLRYCPFPLPPLAEQKRIVEKCDRLMSLCDTLEAKLKQGRDSSEKLMEVAAKQVLTA
ncbi:restriction endonuclease subunit S [Tolypothrix sp. PCC 7910]|uniref:restriction endonuclease subunit S n=1 Tax=Tolypothrix sp. PCC 7910 TaxID=2099387 RepID=UPI001427833A|nr:restriction endonuclease subunit S [Tolypothrix sp. PCC 7910]QIR38506.1 restriction endonuclease subunit S [Tolypothrix sp. PCC 7910]